MPSLEIPAVLAALEARGWRARAVPLGRLRDLAARMAAWRAEAGGVDAVAATMDRYIDFRPPDELSETASVVVVVMPSPPAEATFVWRGEQRRLGVPSNYPRNDENEAGVWQAIDELLAPHGVRRAATRLPEKLLTVSCGLARYGRNNVAYVGEWGSYIQLVTRYVDLPCDEVEWTGPVLLERCHDCDACRRACPTGAIGDDRFPLYVERCLTFHNENAGELPAWIDATAHNSLIGCVRCQRVCPADAGVRDWVGEKAAFDEGETALLLDASRHGELSAGTRGKLQRLGLLADYLPPLPRNLALLLEGDSGRAG